MHRYTVVNKLKILIGFYQIVIKVDRVYEIRLPDEIRAFLQQLECVISLGLEGVPLACVGAEGYTQRLLLWILLPLLLVFGVTLVIFVQLSASRRFTVMGVVKRVMPISLGVFFLLYPIVTNVAFEVFCESSLACMKPLACLIESGSVQLPTAAGTCLFALQHAITLF